MFEAARATEVSAIGPESTAQTPYERRESPEIDGAGSSKSDPEFGALARAAGPGDAKRREARDEPSFEGVRASAAEPATDELKVLNEAAHSKERAGSDLAAGSSGQIAESAIDEPSADTSGNESDIDELVQDEGDPVRAENWASAAGGGGLRGDLGRLTVDREQPLPPLIGEFRGPRRGSRRGTAFFLGVTTTVLAALAYGYATQNWKLVSSYVPGIATAFAPPTTVPAKPQPEPPALKTAHNSVEKLPAPGEGRVLSMEEVRYCIFQGRRLSELRNQMTGLGGNDLVNRYNNLVTDFNSRCRSFRYEKGVMEAIQREAAEKEVQLKADASAILAAWHPGSAQPQPVKATEPQVRDEPLIDLAATWGAARVQMRLMDLGFYRGTIDGVWGPKSKRALKNFKENNGLGVDDNWDIGTQSALLGKES
jgi:Putative peptidoglycan binding domain